MQEVVEMSWMIQDAKVWSNLSDSDFLDSGPATSSVIVESKVLSCSVPWLSFKLSVLLSSEAESLD